MDENKRLLYEAVCLLDIAYRDLRNYIDKNPRENFDKLIIHNVYALTYIEDLQDKLEYLRKMKYGDK